MRKLRTNRDCFIIVRCTYEDKKELLRLAGGGRRLSKFIRNKLNLK